MVYEWDNDGITLIIYGRSMENLWSMLIFSKANCEFTRGYHSLSPPQESLELGALPWPLEDGPLLPHAVAMVLYERRRQMAMKKDASDDPDMTGI